MNGSITTIIGPMYASKSTELQRHLRRAQLAGKRVLMIKPAIDDRYSDADVVTHDGLAFPAHSVSSVHDMWNIIDSYEQEGGLDVLGIDEAQFLSGEILDLVDEVSREPFGVDVFIAGLDTDFRGLPFDTMIPLVFKSDAVQKLTAICVCCGNDATRTQRIVGDKPATSGELVVVGGQESYEARCRHCFISSKSFVGVTI